MKSSKQSALVKRVTRSLISRLFSTGEGKHAKRLVLETVDCRYAGGWCKLGVQRQIEKVLEREGL